MAKILVLADETTVSETLLLRLAICGHTTVRATEEDDGDGFHMVLMDRKEAPSDFRNRGYGGLIVAITDGAAAGAVPDGFDACLAKPLGRDFEDRIAAVLHDAGL